MRVGVEPTCTVKAVLPTPPSPRTVILKSIRGAFTCRTKRGVSDSYDSGWEWYRRYRHHSGRGMKYRWHCSGLSSKRLGIPPHRCPPEGMIDSAQSSHGTVRYDAGSLQARERVDPPRTYHDETRSIVDNEGLRC
jgi:hypothetical protein